MSLNIHQRLSVARAFCGRKIESVSQGQQRSVILTLSSVVVVYVMKSQKRAAFIITVGWLSLSEVLVNNFL